VVVGWSVPEADASPLIGFIRERHPNLAIVSIGERSSDSAREAGADEYGQRGASMLTRLPMGIEEAVRKRAEPSAAPPLETGTPSAPVDAPVPETRFEMQAAAGPGGATEMFPLESAGGEPLGVTSAESTPAATIRIGFAGDIEQARILASIDASIEIVPMADVAATGVEGAPCAAVVVDHTQGSLDVQQTLNEVRGLSLPAILLYDPAAADAAFHAFADDADD